MGDQVCHLDSVCLSCGRFIEGEVHEAAMCPRCGEPVDGSRGGITVRVAVPADAAAVGAITEAAYRVDGFLEGDEEYADELRDAEARMADGVVLVAEIGGAMVGSLTLVRHGAALAEVTQPGEVEVRMLSVAPDARRRGVARALMDAAMEWARAEGLARVVLCTLTTMKQAHRLYESLGYERLPERDWSVGPFTLIGYGRAVT